MTYCIIIVEHFVNIAAGFSSTNTSMRGMRQVFQDRANDVGPQDDILQTPFCKIRRVVSALLLREKNCGAGGGT
jgi:hypothetical protein